MGITRQTKQVKTLLNIFDNNEKAISVVDLIKLLEAQMNKTTVYRILDKLMDDGVVHSFVGKGGLKWYAKCQDCSCETHNDVHPHFQCKTCGEVECLSVSFTLPPINGYMVESASLFIVGVCSNCL
ncbi:transcriptional regulator [Flavivirga aquatica]|uniref:Transcriptional regulator n=1 Tax=Flavivirga aquatica TaxID=1849968 RepID=A0A1E5TAD2_9FLAO|nr:transcriptional repressor [Flavivirga aquatica]OEK08324.1 transcriptional regulator [Flavivirga aquatica]